MADSEGKPIPVGDEITVKVDTAAIAHDVLLATLTREVHRLAGLVARVEQLALQAILRANQTVREPKN